MNILEKIALTKIKGIGPKLSRILLAYNGSVEDIFRSSKKQLLAIPGIGETITNTIQSKSYRPEAEEEHNFILKHDIQVDWIEDKNYPKRLNNCDDSPVLLYYKGTTSLNPPKVVSIVGTRNSITYGKRICEDFIQQLKAFDAQIISDLAHGIDSYAHRESLKNQIPTIGILGHGLERIYPASHRELASRMFENGGLLTKFPSGTNPDRQNFPRRNCIIEGLSDVTIVGATALKGGALITAEIANTYNRDVCTFLGAIGQEYSAGYDYLMKTNRAHLIRNVADLAYLMNWKKEDKRPFRSN
jgi:DNA processing protein